MGSVNERTNERTKLKVQIAFSHIVGKRLAPLKVHAFTCTSSNCWFVYRPVYKLITRLVFKWLVPIGDNRTRIDFKILVFLKENGLWFEPCQIGGLVSARHVINWGDYGNGYSTTKAFSNPGSMYQKCSLIMAKLVRRSHYDLFLQFRSNHLQYRIQPGNFWNDFVSLVHFIHFYNPSQKIRTIFGTILFFRDECFRSITNS